jgi:pyruvate dehydrogenase E1 component alpha subunit
LLEARCYRFMGHSMSDPVHGHYRTRAEVEAQKQQDPIKQYFTHLLRHGLVDQAGLEAIDQEVRAIVDQAIAFADASPEPDVKTILEGVYA